MADKYILVIHKNGSVTKEAFDSKDVLKQLQTLVGGYIERVTHFPDKHIDVYGCEDGIAKRFSINMAASSTFKCRMYGDLAIAKHNPKTCNIIGMTERDVEWFKKSYETCFNMDF